MPSNLIILPPVGVAKYCEERVGNVRYVCLSVRNCERLSARISPELHVQLSPIMCMLSTAVARSSSNGVAIHYVLPVYG